MQDVRVWMEPLFMDAERPLLSVSLNRTHHAADDTRKVRVAAGKGQEEDNFANFRPPFKTLSIHFLQHDCSFSSVILEQNSGSRKMAVRVTCLWLSSATYCPQSKKSAVEWNILGKPCCSYDGKGNASSGPFFGKLGFQLSGMKWKRNEPHFKFMTWRYLVTST